MAKPKNNHRNEQQHRLQDLPEADDDIHEYQIDVIFSCIKTLMILYQ